MSFYPQFQDEGALIAGWGDARLIKFLDRHTELRGGTDQDRAAALESPA